MISLKAQLAAALAGATSQNPIDTTTLAQGHHRHAVEDALMDMYQAREVNCCRHTKGSKTCVVWWAIGHTEKPPTYLLAKDAKARRAAVKVEI